MADIKFTCPNCTLSIEASEDMRGQIVDCPNCRNPIRVPEPTNTHSPGNRPPQELQTNVKQGALIGAISCFFIGLIFMTWSLLTFFVYGPLFFAAFVLSIVAMAQKRVLGGLLMLLATLIVPPVLGLFLAASRASATAIALNQAFDQAAADYQRESANQFQSMPHPPAMPQLPKNSAATSGLQVTDARFFFETNFFGYPHIEFNVRNQTGTAIGRIYCHGRLSSPGRTIPWADQDFNVAIPGGLEPGETKKINLRPPQNGPYGHGELKDRTDLVMEVAITDAEDAPGTRLGR